MDITIEEITWGFVVPECPATGDDKWHFIVAPELPAGPERMFQFCRIRARFDANSTPKPTFVLTFSPVPRNDATREAVRSALLRDAPGACIAVLRADRVGFAEVEPDPNSPGELVAAAVAVAKANGAWDETDPLVIEVGDASFSVRALFEAAHWHAIVRAG